MISLLSVARNRNERLDSAEEALRRCLVWPRLNGRLSIAVYYTLLCFTFPGRVLVDTPTPVGKREDNAIRQKHTLIMMKKFQVDCKDRTVSQV
jgi:hypothetical protein